MAQRSSLALRPGTRRLAWLLLAISPVVAGGWALYAFQRPANNVASTTAPDGAAGKYGDGSATVPQQPLLRAIWDALGAEDSIAQDDSNRARSILTEADPLLSRIKTENAEALRQVNRQQRIADLTLNVVLVVADDLSPSDLVCYGGNVADTPHCDGMAADGIRFTSAQADRHQEAFARFALHSGNTAREASFADGIVRLGPAMTLAETMWQGGYQTIGLGKWGLDLDLPENQPWRRGFDLWIGFPREPQDVVEFPTELARNGQIVGSDDQPLKGRHTADQLAVAEAVDICRRQKVGRPFFLYVSLTLPYISSAPRADAVTAFDSHVGQILSELETLDLDRKTVVIVTSDGPGQGKVDQSRLVPLLIRLPRHLQAGTISNAPATLADLLPTLCDLTNTRRRPVPIDGESLVPAMQHAQPASKGNLPLD